MAFKWPLIAIFQYKIPVKLRWVPSPQILVGIREQPLGWGKETKTHPGLGLVTMIAGRNMRVMWRTGEVVWMTEDRLVHISNLIKLRKK